MKHFLILLVAISIVGCKKEAAQIDYISLSGKVSDRQSDTLVVINQDDYEKVIKLNADGTFRDTLNIKPGFYMIHDGNQAASLFLKNGYDLTINLNAPEFNKSISFSGEGAENNTYLSEHSKLQEQLFDNIEDIDENNLESTMSNIDRKLTAYYNSNKAIDTLITSRLQMDLNPMLMAYRNFVSQKIAFTKQFPKGSTSPTFSGYENYKGGTTSLSDLKGKYVYIDIWATWCGPCKVEFPALKQLEKAYEGKNIHFVSISVDDANRSGGGNMEVAKEKWKRMIAEMELGGIQLFSDKNWESDFVKSYQINAIPRFILLDPNGNIVTADAPRPSDPKLVELLNDLKI